MKKKSPWTREAMDRVEEWIEYWVGLLSLAPVSTNLSFLDNPHTDDGTNVTNMDIVSGFPYRTMDIRIFPSMATMSNRRIGIKTCHELMHYVVKPMERYRLSEPQYFNDQQEVVVEQLAMAFEHLAHELDKSRKAKRKKESRLFRSKKGQRTHKLSAKKIRVYSGPRKKPDDAEEVAGKTK